MLTQGPLSEGLGAPGRVDVEDWGHRIDPLGPELIDQRPALFKTSPDTPPLALVQSEGSQCVCVCACVRFCVRTLRTYERTCVCMFESVRV